MRVELQLFAVARQRAGADRLTLEVPERATVADLKARIAEACPALAPILPGLLIAVNHEYARDDHPIPPDADLAAIPPVSGG